MANRGLAVGIPIWVRVPGIIALVLVGVLLSAMLLGATGVAGSGGGGGGMDHNQEQQQDQEIDPDDSGGGGHRPPGGGH